MYDEQDDLWLYVSQIEKSAMYYEANIMFTYS